jgi:ABC-2 type transport system ATP-binding protein
MCSHILSDIEVLCDNVAILKQGRAAHAGSLEELRAGQKNAIEIIATGATAGAVSDHLSSDATIADTPAGLRIEVAEEKAVDEAIAALRKAGGKLVSVQPVRQSLEELFL